MTKIIKNLMDGAQKSPAKNLARLFDSGILNGTSYQLKLIFGCLFYHLLQGVQCRCLGFDWHC